MKPPEILFTLEEAAGTCMYGTKKEAALKTLEKKQSKVDEINKLLDDQELLPALEKLRKERMQYMQWANGNAELDRLKRFCIAFEYAQAGKIKDNAVQGVEGIKVKISEISGRTESMHIEVHEMGAKVSELTAAKEVSIGGEIKCLSEKVDALSQDLVRETSLLKNEEDSLMTERENAVKLEKSIEELKQSAEERASAVKSAEDGAADLKERVEELSRSLEEHEKEYQGVVAGKSSGNEEKCLDDQLGDAKVAVGRAKTELKQLKTKISHCEKEPKEKKHQLLSKQEESFFVENEHKVRKKDVENVRRALECISYKEGQMEALETMKFGFFLHDWVNVDFTYRDPVKNFDRSRVKGVVAKLIKVKDSSAMTAFEVGNA
ncbi:hypothetical protein RJ640_005834 [Escallonia rubra]|uniref:Uncharacterized protein n=1 Tax=Escallonia rubra TaxID=112253 RepID=A0AA88UTR9_9ASTE|nr:hypothetical protein RJ640_005834 [Escallonia rubra]